MQATLSLSSRDAGLRGREESPPRARKLCPPTRHTTHAQAQRPASRGWSPHLLQLTTAPKSSKGSSDMLSTACTAPRSLYRARQGEIVMLSWTQKTWRARSSQQSRWWCCCSNECYAVLKHLRCCVEFRAKRILWCVRGAGVERNGEQQERMDGAEVETRQLRSALDLPLDLLRSAPTRSRRPAPVKQTTRLGRQLQLHLQHPQPHLLRLFPVYGCPRTHGRRRERDSPTTCAKRLEPGALDRDHPIPHPTEEDGKQSRIL